MNDVSRRSMRIATLFTALGWLVTILGGLFVIAGAVHKASRGDPAHAALILVGGGLYLGMIALYAFAGGALLRLMVAVEESTRETAQALSRTAPR
jgi:hypothetical protein